MVYTCALNDGGGVESDLTVTAIESGSGLEHSPEFEVSTFLEQYACIYDSIYIIVMK